MVIFAVFGALDGLCELQDGLKVDIHQEHLPKGDHKQLGDPKVNRRGFLLLDVLEDDDLAEVVSF